MQPVQQRLLGDGTADLRVATKRLRETLRRRSERDGSEERIGVVDGFEFDQLTLCFGTVLEGIGHCAKGDGPGNLPVAREKIMLGFGSGAMNQLHHHVAVEERAALFGKPGEERLAKRFHAGDGGDPQNETGKENAKSREPSAHFAACELKSEGNPPHAERSSATMRPS